MKSRILASLILFLTTGTVFAQDPQAEVFIDIAATTSGEEPSTPGQFTVSLIGGTKIQICTFEYLVSGDALPGAAPSADGTSDYETLSGTVQFASSAATAFIDVNVFDDITIEGTEQVVVTLVEPSAANSSCPSVKFEGEEAPFAPLDIADNDASLTVIKTMVNDNGGTAVAANWTMDVTAVLPSSSSFPGAEDPGTTIIIGAGDYSVAESGGPTPYTQTLGDGCSGTVVAGQVVSCTITNDDIAPQLTVIKHVINDNGGAAVAADWTMDVTATNPSDNNFAGAEDPGVTITIDAGDYSVAESGGPAGYTLTSMVGCSGSLALGETATCTLVNDDDAPGTATLTIIKHVINDNGGAAVAADWTMDVTATNPSDNNFAGAEDPGVTITIDAGDYSVAESGGPAGYTLTSMVGCSGTLAADASATCTLVNDDNAPGTATLTIIKHVINDNGGAAVAADWTMDVTATNPSDNNFAGAEDPGVTITIDAGDYSVAESGGPAGYTLTSMVGCSGTLAADASATCTLVNDDDAPGTATLTIIKHVINDNGGAAVAADWTMDVTATNPSDNNFAGAEDPGVTITIDAGDYSVAESGGPAGYTLTSMVGCSGTLAADASATCTLVNDDNAPGTATLTIIKHVINDNGGAAVAADWTMDVTATNPSDNNFAGAEDPGVTITIDAGDYSVAESGGPAGYTLTSMVGCSGTLAADASATCTLVNDDDAPGTATLTIIKHVINDNGGAAVAADWTMDVTATNPSDNNFAGAEDPGVTITIDAGDYSVAESGGPAGYTLTSMVGCSGTLAADASATCTLVNDDNAPGTATLTIIKHVINDNGGAAVAADWTMDVTATNPSDNNFAGAEDPGVTITIDAGDYSVAESGGPAGYTLTSMVGCSGTLAADASATCTLVNDDDAPGTATLTIIKHVINDNGGAAVAADWTMDVTATNPSDNNFAGAEDPGVTITIDAGDYSVAESGGPAGYTLTSMVGCSGTLAADASATCTLVNDDDAVPALSITKTTNPNPTSFTNVGDLIHYDYVVSSSGNTPVAGPITVTDDKTTVTCPDVSTVGNNDANLDLGESITCTSVYAIVLADITAESVTNKATAFGGDAASVESGEVQVTVDYRAPVSLTLVKSSDVTSFEGIGNIINYSYKVTSSGQGPALGPITVADDKTTVTCPDVSTVGNNDANLDPGEMIICTASYAVVIADIVAGMVTNTAMASSQNTDSNEAQVTVFLARPIPTLGQWALVLLGLLLGMMAIAPIRRRVTAR